MKMINIFKNIINNLKKVINKFFNKHRKLGLLWDIKGLIFSAIFLISYLLLNFTCNNKIIMNLIIPFILAFMIRNIAFYFIYAFYKIGNKIFQRPKLIYWLITVVISLLVTWVKIRLLNYGVPSTIICLGISTILFGYITTCNFDKNLFRYTDAFLKS